MIHRQYKFQSTGVITYDPPRPGLKNRDWWCVVEADEDLANYYRWQLERRYSIKTLPPSWGSHISIIRGETPAQDKQHLWTKYDGMKIEFEYTHDVYGNGNFWWINIYNPMLPRIRDEFGFPSNWGQHLTVARLHNNWPVREDQFCKLEDES